MANSLRVSDRGVTRRAVLAGGASLAVGAALPAAASLPRAHTSPRPDRRTPKRVVVVGAGLAGMTTALDLRDKGWDVVVLEARDRVGGRVHTLYDPFTTGLHAESGGESIDDGHYAIQAMLKRFGLRTEERPPTKPYDSAVYYKVDARAARRVPHPQQRQSSQRLPALPGRDGSAR